MATPSPVDILMARLGRVTPGLQALDAAAANLAQSFRAATSGLAQAFAPLTAAVSPLTAAFRGLAQAVRAAVPRPVAQAAGGAVQVAAGVGNAAAGAGSALVDAFAGPMVAFKQVAGAAAGFVQALNPAAVMAMNLELRNLAAAIGVALEPVIRVAVGVLAEFNSAITPVMQKLRPVVEQVAKAFGQVASVFAGAFASVLTSLAPLFQFLADAISAVVPVVEAFYAGIAGFVKAFVGVVRGILSYFGVDMDSVMDGFKSAMRDMAQAALEAAATVLRWVDALAGSSMAADFVEGIRDALTPDDSDRRKTTAVATNAQVGGLAEFTNQFARNALLAGPGGVQSKDDEERAWRERVIDSLDGIVDGNTGEVLKKILDALNRIAERGIQKVWDSATETAREVAGDRAGFAVAFAPTVLGMAFGGR